jgi:uncharacterized protein
MRRYFVAVGAALMLLAMTGTALGETLDGNWVGGFERGKDWIFVLAHFRVGDNGIQGTYDIPLEFTAGRSLNQVSLTGSRVRFEMPRKPSGGHFDGTLKNGAISGGVTEEGCRLPFHLRRLAASRVANIAGTYEVAKGHSIHIRPWVEMGRSDARLFIDFQTGRVGMLFPVSATTFITGPSLLVTHPVAATVRFTIDSRGEPSDFDWRWERGARMTGKRLRFREEHVSFGNGDVTLGGTLVLPDTPGPHPGVVMVPASTAAASRVMLWHMAEFYALYGVAGLIYDKRGIGASTGDWLKSGFEDLATDALAAVQFLQKRPEIDRKQIGLWGASQSGWIVALAASRSHDVAFIISQSGPGVTPYEQELYRAGAWLRADGFSEAQIQKAIALVRFRYACANTDTGWDKLAAAEREAKEEPWYPYTGGAAGRNDPFWPFWRLIRDYDPAPALEKVRCPVLAVFGGRDTYLPAEKSVAVWKRCLKKAGNRDVTIKLFPEGDHSLIQAKTGGLRESSRLNRLVPGYFPLMRDWVLQRVRVRQ